MAYRKGRLTEQDLKELRSDGKPKTIADGQGLSVVVAAKTDRLSWYYRYYTQKKPTGFVFGTWPLISLAEARHARDAIAGLLAVGLDPQMHMAEIYDSIRTFRAADTDPLANIARQGALHALATYQQGVGRSAI
jgi:hypothetical protein